MKKLLTLMLSVMMVLSLTACGKKLNTVTDTLNAMNKFEANSVDAEVVMDIASEDINLAMKISGEQTDNKNLYMELLVKGNVEDYEIKNYTKVTDIYIENGENFYINLASVLDFAAELDSQFAMLAGFLDFPEDYLKITKSEILEFLEDADVEMTEKEFDELFTTTKVNDKDAQQLMKVVGDFLDGYIKNGNKKVGSVNNGVVTLTLNEKNAEDALKSLNELDVEKFMKDYFEAAEKILPSLDSSEVLSDIEGANEEIADALKNFDASDLEDIDMNVSFGIKDKKVFMDMKMDIEGDQVTMNITSTKSKTKKLSFPAASFGLDEIENLINSLF